MGVASELFAKEYENILFLDLEWNQRLRRQSKRDELVEIGMTTCNGEKRETFFSHVKSAGLVNSRTRQILRTGAKDKETAADPKTICSKLTAGMAEADLIVMWSRETKNMLDLFLQKYGGECPDEVFFLQDILGENDISGEQISFERTCITYIDDYDSVMLHNAGYDSECLCRLFFLLKDAYCKAGNDGNIKAYMITMDPDGEKARTNSMIRKLAGKAVTDEEFAMLAGFFHLGCKEIFGFFEVRSGYSVWHVYLKDGYVSGLSHENYHPGDYHGFHHHEITDRDAYHVLDYIAKHDSMTQKKPKTEDYRRSYEKRVGKRKHTKRNADFMRKKMSRK